MSPETCRTDVCSCIFMSICRKGNDVLTRWWQQWGFSLNTSTHFTEPVSSDITYVIVSSYGYTSMWAGHCVICGKPRATYTVAWHILQLPSILKTQCILKFLFVESEFEALAAPAMVKQSTMSPFSEPRSIALCSATEISPFTCSALLAMDWYFSWCRADLTEA